MATLSRHNCGDVLQESEAGTSTHSITLLAKTGISWEENCRCNISPICVRAICLLVKRVLIFIWNKPNLKPLHFARMASKPRLFDRHLYCLSTEWPKGKFCILANGRCPKGFKRHEGHLKSLYLYSSHSQFVNSAKFGSSSIGCFGSYCGQYGNFIGSLTLITCCK